MKLLTFMAELEKDVEQDENNITFNDYGHFSEYEIKRWKATLLDSLKGRIEFYKTQKDKEPNKNLNDKEYYQKRYEELQEELAEDMTFPFEGLVTLHPAECYCFKCGARLEMVITGEREVSAVTKKYVIKDSKHAVEYVKEECPLKDGNTVSEVTIDVPTGELVFLNFIRTERFEPKERYSQEYDINCHQGCVNLAKYYASQNVGYGQMGNMYTNVFQKDNSIIIGNNEYYEGWKMFELVEQGRKTKEEIKDDKKQLKRLKPYTNKGNICLDVWRWMCIDKSLTTKEEIENEHNPPIIVKVKPGTYKIKHYFRTKEHSDIIHATIERINP